MFELIQVSERTSYIQSPAKIGLVHLEGNEVCLIDSGNDKDAGRKIRQILDAGGWKLKAIYNTHANADHIGGNRYLQGQTGCRIYAPGIDCAITCHPILEPAFLYGGYPCKDLRHKFLLAQESNAELLTDEVLPEGFLADCLSSPETLEKYRIGFIYDVGAYLQTLEKVKSMEARLFIPSHAEATPDIAELAQLNIDNTLAIAEEILILCTEPRCFEDLLQRIFERYRLTMNFEQYVLVGSTVRSFLSWMKDCGKLNASFEDNRLLWCKAQ